MKPDETVLSLFLFFAPLNPSTYLRCVASIQLLCVFFHALDTLQQLN